MSELPTIPLYHVDHLIAEGGTARVYWGIDLRSGFPVAIKELKIKHFKNQQIRENFKRVETQLYLYMKHPNIPKLVDFVDIRESGQMYIIMEFIKGISLEQYIYGEMGLIPDVKALPIFLEILDTVAYLHRNDILHLDIKPNNVIIQPDGHIKLIDLGIAARMSDASNSTGFGTPAYMPPEQTEKGVCGRYTDIFALGVMLFEMLTGTLPFRGHDRQELRQKIKNDPTPLMSSFYPPINIELQYIVERALAKNPSDRYKSCEEFANMIKDYIIRNKLIV